MSSVGALAAELRAHPLPGVENWLLFATVGSTHQVARRIVGRTREPRPLAIYSVEQRSGHGRWGRDWVTPAGSIAATLAAPGSVPTALAAAPLIVATALAEVLDEGGLNVGLKWPNDLMLRGRKLGGVLVDAFHRPGGRVVPIVSFGINVRDSASIPPEGISLEAAGVGGSPSVEALSVRCAAAVLAALDRGGVADAVEQFERRSIHRSGDMLTCRLGAPAGAGTAPEVVVGRYVGLDPEGFLLLEDDSGRRRIASAEIEHEH